MSQQNELEKLSFKEKITFIVKKYRYIIIGLVVLLLIVISSGAYYINWSLKPARTGETGELEIPRGSSSAEIAEMLEEEGFIKSSFTFRILTLYKGYTGSYQAGTYELTSELTPLEIAIKIKEGDVIDSSIRFTIPEGLRADEVAEILANHQLGDKDRYMELFNSPEKFDYWFIKDKNESNSVKYSLEGYLYPETYEIKEDASEREIIDKLLSQFNAVFKDNYKERKEGLDMNINEIVTLASIVEREAIIHDERPKVAGVFYNRLQEERKLEACSTVEYVLQENKSRLTREDTQIESNYNTYQNLGLPPGPIASPGKKSIEAALYPEEHDYFYFVSKEDGSGEHVFSETHSEHIRARNRIRND